MELKNILIANSLEDLEAQHSEDLCVFSANFQKEIAESKAREAKK
jgi:hypothetical protein